MRFPAPAYPLAALKSERLLSGPPPTPSGPFLVEACAVRAFLVEHLAIHEPQNTKKSAIGRAR